MLPEITKITNPLEYARMAQKVLHREYEEGVRARDALLVVRAHIEDQLQQLDILIMLKEKELQMRQEVEKASSSAD